MNKARLEERYLNEIRPKLKEKLGLDNIEESPRLRQVVLNVGSKEAVGDSKVITNIVNILTKIAGQKAVRTLARKSIAGFKIRAGMAIGAKVTLRRKRMYEFLDKLVSLALPKERDFQGLPTKLDGRGGYNIGIKEWIIFPEVDYGVADKVYGLNITISTFAKNDAHARELLQEIGIPFKK